MERTVALMDVGVVALEAVTVQELLDGLHRSVGGVTRSGREGRGQGQQAAEGGRGSEFRKQAHDDGQSREAQAKRPVLLPKASVSTPIFWAMST
jgi:hypothetical protein